MTPADLMILASIQNIWDNLKAPVPTLNNNPTTSEKTDPAAGKPSAGDFRSRMVEEADELRERLAKLNRFIESDSYRELPVVHQVLLTSQRSAMFEYHRVLRLRLEHLSNAH